MTTAALPRSVLYAGVPVLIGALAVALWAWDRWGMAVFFDTVSGGLSICP